MTEIEKFRGGVFPWEIDVMGHMNVRFYTAKFDEATVQMFGMLGLTIAYCKEQEREMAAVHQTMTYRRELLAGGLVVVKTEILDVDDKKIRFVHIMYECLSGDEASKCETMGVQIDRMLRWSTPIPKHIGQKALERGEAQS